MFPALVARRLILAAEWALLGLLAGVTLPASVACPGPYCVYLPAMAKQASAPLAAHPRLWLTGADVTRYRSWAVPGNPVWASGLAPLAERARAEMDAGSVPGLDCGNVSYEDYPTEMYAELFAFLSLVGPDSAERASDAQRARSLLMFMLNAADQGPAAVADYTCGGSLQYPPFRHPDFFTSDRDRPRYHGEAFGLTVDWIYPILTPADKTVIARVFTRWAEDVVTRGYHHPEPVGLLNDPLLLQDRLQVRFSGNNYYAAHMRNLALLALALDESDDPGGELHAYLDSATGAYLYILNDLTAGAARGGLLPEGLEYSPQTASYITQFAWAMRTAQKPFVYDSAFWDDFLPAYWHTLSPAARPMLRSGEWFDEYQASWYGDAQEYRLPDFINVWGALAHLAPNEAARSAIRWNARNTAPGGAARFLERVRNPADFREALLYFMLFDPAAAAPADPRPAQAVDFAALGMNRLFSRTGWGPTAAWFTFRLGWNSIDHQMADGNHFEFFRQGEWLTKGRTGYANIAEGIASSEFYNTLAVQNSPPSRGPGDWRTDLWQRGSQWNLVASGDPALTAYSFNPAYTYASGDATPLYNSTSEAVTDVVHVSRSLVWLKADDIVVYDRAETGADGRFKRWWLQLAQPAVVTGTRAAAATAGGQQLFVQVLLPAGAVLQAVNAGDPVADPTVAQGEPMAVRLMTEAPGAPRSVRFLHVLQGADAGAAADPASLVRSLDGLWEGAVISQTAVLFARDLGQAPPATLIYTSPLPVHVHLITGLAPLGAYTAAAVSAGAACTVTVTAGGARTADSGGVLRIDLP